MSKNKKQNNIVPKKTQETIGTRITKAVFEEKKISERIFGYIPYDINFVKATYTGKYYYDSRGTAPAGSKYSGVKNGIIVDRINNNAYGVHIKSADGKYNDLGWVKKSQLSGYDTGGYTGT